MPRQIKAPTLRVRVFVPETGLLHDPEMVGLTQIPCPAIAVPGLLFVCLREQVRNAAK